MVTHGAQLDAPLGGGTEVSREAHRRVPVGDDLGDAMVELTGLLTTRKVWREAVGVVGAITPWNFPFEVTINKLGQALATGQHRRAEARAGHAVQRDAPRPADRGTAPTFPQVSSTW